MKKMGFAQTDWSVYEKGIVSNCRIIGYSQRGGMGKLIAWTDHKTGKCVYWIQGGLNQPILDIVFVRFYPGYNRGIVAAGLWCRIFFRKFLGYKKIYQGFLFQERFKSCFNQILIIFLQALLVKIAGDSNGEGIVF